MARPSDPEEVAAKQSQMGAYFDAALERVAFLDELVARGRESEALTLCLIYIDRFAQLLHWPRKSVGKNIVDALCKHDRHPFLSLVHPLEMIRAMNAMNDPWRSRAATLKTHFPGPQYELMDPLKFLKSISSSLTSAELADLRQELWRGTIAAVAYYWMRIPSVHGFGSSPSLHFDNTKYRGVDAPQLNLHVLKSPLRSMIEEARSRSIAACEWFGDDRILFAT